MESGIDPGQEYYTQDYYSCNHGFVPRYPACVLTHDAAADVTTAPPPRAVLLPA